MMTTFSDERLIGQYELPPGATVLFNVRVYMDDETWAIAADKIAVQWWACYMYDGFGSHISISEALETFYQEKIHIPKEEAATS
eukprot:10513886-Ditylum_brightwellii.AAC.1